MLPTTDDLMKNLEERFEKMLLAMSNLAESPWMPPALGHYIYGLERRAVQIAMKLAAKARISDSGNGAGGGNGVSAEPRKGVSKDGMNAVNYSLADFYFSESDDPMVPAPEYTEWREAGEWATSLYEPNLLAGPVPRTQVLRAGKRQSVINLTSYNYMGFAKHPAVVEAAREALSKYGTGACGSPLLSGMADLHAELEAKLSAFMGRESTMLFNSGFGGAMGGLAGMLRKGDRVAVDAKVHLSLIAGVTLARARMEFFDHNDPASLDSVLEKSKGKRRLVVVEGVYSMDGDMADLPALLPVCEKHGVGVFIDEAHSILAWGKTGRGVTEHHNTGERVGMVFATFSKSFASCGGFVCGTKGILDYLRYYSHPYGFSCAMPPSNVAGLLKVLEIMEADGDAIRKRLWDNTRYMHKQLHGLGIDTGESTTQVIPVMCGSNRDMLYELCHEMNDKGLFLAPVDYPSVPEDGLRFRAAVTAAHTRQDLDEALGIIEDTVVRRLRERGAGRSN
jgi:7-keto-8-aminopelargonate synthetase-like enzyme